MQFLDNHIAIRWHRDFEHWNRGLRIGKRDWTMFDKCGGFRCLGLGKQHLLVISWGYWWLSVIFN